MAEDLHLGDANVARLGAHVVYTQTVAARDLLLTPCLLSESKMWPECVQDESRV